MQHSIVRKYTGRAKWGAGSGPSVTNGNSNNILHR
jgi:hypothetical protein